MIKNRDIPRIDDIWIKYDGTRYKIIDVAKDVYSNKNLVICYKIPINEKYQALAYRLEDFMQEMNDEQYDNLLKESYFCKQNSNLRPKYKFNLDHCGRYIFCESKEKKLDKDYEDKKIVNSYQMYSCFKNIEFTHIFDIKIYILIS